MATNRKPKADHTVEEFTTQRELVNAVINRLGEYNMRSVADASDVSISTLYKWVDGDVENPRSDTLFRVAEVIGFEIEWNILARLRLVN